MPENYDVVIVGGAVMGASVAYHLAAETGSGRRILALEKDPSYAKAATALSVSSIRQQFSTEINIRISLYGIAFLRDVAERLAVGPDRPAISLVEGGYLFLATAQGQVQLAANHALQTALGADIVLHNPMELAIRFPWLATDGLAAGAWGRTGEGWFDGWGLMQAFKAKARALGAEFRTGEVVDLVRDRNKITHVVLSDGSRIGAGVVVNCAGRGARELALRAGVDIPVHARKRMVFSFQAENRLAHFPLLVDPTGVYARPEGRGFLAGSAPLASHDPEADENDFEVDHSFFEEIIWPTLAARVPAFERIKHGRAWACHYDMNMFDHNAFIGTAGTPANFYLCNGFSGHGLQQAPAIGRGLAELIAHGRFQTLDLSPLGFDRLAAGRPVREDNVV